MFDKTELLINHIKNSDSMIVNSMINKNWIRSLSNEQILMISDSMIAHFREEISSTFLSFLSKAQREFISQERPMLYVKSNIPHEIKDSIILALSEADSITRLSYIVNASTHKYNINQSCSDDNIKTLKHIITQEIKTYSVIYENAFNFFIDPQESASSIIANGRDNILRRMKHILAWVYECFDIEKTADSLFEFVNDYASMKIIVVHNLFNFDNDEQQVYAKLKFSC